VVEVNAHEQKEESEREEKVFKVTHSDDEKSGANDRELEEATEKLASQRLRYHESVDDNPSANPAAFAE
jgi:hypothetical protein